MNTWKGVSHARMTRSMSALRGGEYKVLAAVRRLIPDGERRKFSQADIAKRARVSEGTVSEAMKALDGAYLRRHFLGRGRGRGYEIEVLPPPEQQLPLPFEAPRKGSESDPYDRSFSSGIPTPQTPPNKGSDSDPSIFLDHAHEQQHAGADALTEPQPDSPPNPPAPTNIPPAATLPADIPPQFAALGLRAHHWRQLVEAAPAGYGITQLARDLLKIRSRRDIRTPIAFLRRCLERGEPIFDQAEIDAQNAELAALAGRAEEGSRGGANPGDHGPDGAGPRAGAGDRAARRGRRRVPDGEQPAAAPDRAGGPPPPVRDAPPLTPERAAAIAAAAVARLREKQRRRC